MPLSFAAPEFLWALLALPLVVLLHFVRSRRRRTEVSALFLWRRARQVAERRRRIAPTWLLLA
ncbi:MAG: BatA domain-containing protein, partial [Deinococcales bacterium]